MHIEWLTKQITFDQAETDFLIQDDRISPDPVPFGFNNYHWNNLKSELQDGDELWLFSSPNETWTNMCGRGGICIVRDGEVFKSMVTVMN